MYYERKNNFNLSLWQYFHHVVKQTKTNKIYIPYSTGLNSTPTYPPSPGYACGSLIKHYPWSKHNMLDLNEDKQVLKLFDEFVKSIQCPHILKTEQKRIYASYKQSNKFQQPTHVTSNDDVNRLFGDTPDDISQDTIDYITVMNSFTEFKLFPQWI